MFLSSFTGFYLDFLSLTGFCLVLPSFPGFDRFLHCFYQVLLGFYRVLLGFPWSYWVLPCFTGSLSSFSWFYWVLPSFTGFDWVLLGFIGFKMEVSEFQRTRLFFLLQWKLCADGRGSRLSALSMLLLLLLLLLFSISIEIGRETQKIGLDDAVLRYPAFTPTGPATSDLIDVAFVVSFCFCF